MYINDVTPIIPATNAADVASSVPFMRLDYAASAIRTAIGRVPTKQ
jgi:hypothetical protein